MSDKKVEAKRKKERKKERISLPPSPFGNQDVCGNKSFSNGGKRRQNIFPSAPQQSIWTAALAP